MPPTKRPAAARQRRFHGPQTRRQARAWFRLPGLRNMHSRGWTPRASALPRTGRRGAMCGGMCGEMTGDRRSPPLGKEDAAGRLCVLAMRCVASARTEKRGAIRFQGAALWPRRLRADRGNTIHTALIRLLSVVSVPEEKPPHTPKARRVFVGGLRVV